MRIVLSLLLLTAALAAQTIDQPLRSVTDPGVVTTRQAITPAGVPSIFEGRVYGAAWGASPDDLWILHASQIYQLNWRANKVTSRVAHDGTPGAQAIVYDAVTRQVLAGYARRRKGTNERSKELSKAQLVAASGGSLITKAEDLGSYLPGAFAVATQARNGKRLAVIPLVYENKVAVLDINTGERICDIPTHTAPFAAVINHEGTVAYVSNLGGRPARDNEPFAAPAQKPDEHVPVDARGIASTGSVLRLDLEHGKVTDAIAVGLHPTAMAWDQAGAKLYVANGNSDTVSVLDTKTNRIERTVELQPFSRTVRGVAPTALAVAPNGETLFVACGGLNAVAQVETKTGKLAGLIPTAWYPNGLAISADGQHLAVTALLGAGSAWKDAPQKRYVHAYRGSVSVIALPDEAQLAGFTTAVAENNRLRLADRRSPEGQQLAAARNPQAIPSRSGDPSLIDHVVYIVKENRTYDQVLGDMEKGNGDPSLVMFGRNVTPNQHWLAEQFVLLDSFFATGGNSGDGHQWLTQANETEYCLWPGYQGRSYPFDGSDPMAYSSGGFLWDYALAKGRSVRIYGEYAGRRAEPGNSARLNLLNQWKAGHDFTADWTTRAPIAPVNRILAANYPAYTTAIPDVSRAQIFLEDLKKFEKEKNLPNLVIVQLPSDHTAGTSPGWNTPQAMVADNDLALGQIVEGLSKSSFWPRMAIFVVEDDAQNGVDHVDGHRTTAFVASPYARRGHIDSTFYSHQSMLKTIELILGLPTMSLFDLIANDMRASFTDKPDLRPFEAVQPEQSLFAMNPPASQLGGQARRAAKDSMAMNWSVPDAVPSNRLNRILWGSIKGWQTSYPEVKTSLFAPLSLENEDDEND